MVLDSWCWGCFFRVIREILGLHLELKDVCDPDQEESAAASKYVVLTLPVGWMETVLPGVLEAVVRHGLGGWDPQMGKVPSPEDLEPGEVQYLTEEEAFPYGRGQVAVDRLWTAEEVRDVFDLGPRAIGRAWKLIGLPEKVTFAEAVGVHCVIWLLQDLEPMEADVARTHLHAVAALCKAGPPPEFTYYQVENIHLDVAGVAYALASIPRP